MMEKSTIKCLRIFVLAAMVFTTISAKGQCKFCKSYEDFIDGHWEKLDTVYCKKRIKNQKLWWGDNNYTLTTGNNDLDNILKNEAFIVMQSDTVAFLNCRNIRHDTILFGKGFRRVKRFGNHGLLFANRFANKKSEREILRAGIVTGILLGVEAGPLGSLSASSDYEKRQVCYIISSGADGNGYINTRMIDDETIEEMMEKNIIKDGGLYLKYLSEGKKWQRIHASHVIPILEEAGLIK